MSEDMGSEDMGSDDVSSTFDMNRLLRGEVEDRDATDDEPASIGGRSDAGAGAERTETGARDMNVWLREAVQESRGRPA